ncbi:hypothetical protein J8273_1647 [Carpediemonas membranifera]|uniref:CBM20 domain-containing protein n=1 Tax=Carpediemonas membranifera TaxID=201153 RepID=A0A8J6B1T9_9EUKA|nr:hypothetical protein J8273_1647 [Carpediemonas membranifera]|eukprot:KAG9396630.1 hypothetical protein J8273_1647 [Carpediemonas membranifera]
MQAFLQSPLLRMDSSRLSPLRSTLLRHPPSQTRPIMKCIAVGARYSIVAGKNTVVIYSSDNAKYVSKLEVARADRITSVAIDDDSTCHCGTAKGRIYTFTIPTGRNTAMPAPERFREGHVDAVHFIMSFRNTTRRELWTAGADNTVRVFDVGAGTKAKARVVIQRKAPMTALLQVPSVRGNTMIWASCLDGAVIVIEPKSRKVKRVIESDDTTIPLDMAFDGVHVWIATSEGSLKLYDLSGDLITAIPLPVPAKSKVARVLARPVLTGHRAPVYVAMQSGILLAVSYDSRTASYKVYKAAKAVGGFVGTESNLLIASARGHLRSFAPIMVVAGRKAANVDATHGSTVDQSAAVIDSATAGTIFQEVSPSAFDLGDEDEELTASDNIPTATPRPRHVRSNSMLAPRPPRTPLCRRASMPVITPVGNGQSFDESGASVHALRAELKDINDRAAAMERKAKLALLRASASKKLKTELQGTLAAIEKDKRALEDQKTALEARLQQAESAQFCAEEERASMKAKVVSATEENALLEARVTNAAEDKANLVERLAQAEKEREETQTDLTATQQELKMLHAEHTAAMDRHATVDAKVKQLSRAKASVETELEESRQELEFLEARVRSSAKAKSTLERRLKSTQEDLVEAEKRAVMARDDRLKMEVASSALRKELEQFNDRLTTVTAQAAKAERRVHLLAEDKAVLEARLRQANGEKAELETAVADLKSQLAWGRVRASELESTIEAIASEKRVLEVANEALKGTVGGLEERIAAIGVEYEAMKADLERRIAYLAKEKARLESKAEALSAGGVNERENLAARLGDLASQKEALEARLEEAATGSADQLSAVQAELDILRRENASLELELENAHLDGELQKNALETKLSVLTRQRDDLETRLEESQAELLLSRRDNTATRASFEQTVASLTNERDALEYQRAQSETNRQQTQTELEDILETIRVEREVLQSQMGRRAINDGHDPMEVPNANKERPASPNVKHVAAQRVVEDVRAAVAEVPVETRSYRLVTFAIHYHTYWGQSLMLAGSSPELGAWKLDRALPLRYMGDGHWGATLPLAAGTEVQYKYVAVSPSFVRWENDPAGPNHVVSVVEDVECQDQWSNL